MGFHADNTMIGLVVINSLQCYIYIIVIISKVKMKIFIGHDERMMARFLQDTGQQNVYSSSVGCLKLPTTISITAININLGICFD